MAMTLDEQQRFEMLKAGPRVPDTYVRSYYGLPERWSDAATAAFKQYLKSLKRIAPLPAGWRSRYDLEGFMALAEVMPKKWMGARLGMTLEELEALLAKLDKLGMQRSRYELGSEFVAKSLSEDLTRYLPRLRFCVFSDHTAFCLRLHAELRQAIGVRAKGLFCATSDRLQEYPRLYAADFDCITVLPLSAKHSVWLDFRKPIDLPPDRCSKLFYVEHRDELRPFCAGVTEPGNLAEYEQFFASGKHG